MRKVLAALTLALPIVIITMTIFDLHANYYVCHEYGLEPIIDNMPLVEPPTEVKPTGLAPQEQRGEAVRKWLMPGLKISCSNCSGSGTIVFYDPDSGWAYVQSCGHLWEGNMTAEEGESKNITCKVITWYHNMEKLDSPKTYSAQVIYYSNTRGQDCSLLRFRPDWEPEYYPIAPAGYTVSPGTQLHSVGCDGGREIACYNVRVEGLSGGSWPDLVTVENSPRPGRSGGGLTSNDGYYVGICWGTSSYSGDGSGYFTPLKTFRYFNEQNGYGWLNDVGVQDSLARQIPIVDRNNPQGRYPKNYIPLPGDR